MLVIQIFAWASYTLICVAACIVIYDFLEERIPLWRRKNHDSHKQP